MLACFHECSSLTAIPTGLFDHCTKVVEFYCCFQGCSNLTGETPYTMVDGKKVKLWDRSPENGFANATEKSLMCFSKCGKLSDYAEIPDEWG